MHKIAIIGRPNVGKSTLFNRLVGKRLAIVDDRPGVTRDVREGFGKLFDLEFTVYDTAGLEDRNDDSIESRMSKFSQRVINEVDICFFLIDARAGVTPLDEFFAKEVRKSKKPIVLLANKCESKASLAGLHEAWKLGLGEPIALSAEHGQGLDDIYEILKEVFAKSDLSEEEIKTYELLESNAKSITLEEDDELENEVAPDVTFNLKGGAIQLAIMGRPNAGKSTLVNALLNEERMLTGPEAGITRDAIATDLIWQDNNANDTEFKLIDTAGLRRQSKIYDKVEKLSVSNALASLRFAQVVALVIDAKRGIEKQDLTIAKRVIDEGRCLVVVINKWDLVTNKKEYLQEVEWKLEDSLYQIKGVPIITCSALKKSGINHVLAAAQEVHNLWSCRIKTSKLNQWFKNLTSYNPPPLVSGRQVKVKFISQVKTRPPTFILWSPRADVLPEHWLRFASNNLREEFGLWGIPIRISVKKSRNPYSD